MAAPPESPAPGPPARGPALAPHDPASPALFFNREASLLEFNRRVLRQAQDPAVPLLERLRFLTISTTNLDEFFEVRVAGLKQHLHYGPTPPGIDGLPAPEVLRRVAVVAHELAAEQTRVAREEILPALRKERIRLLRREQWTKAQKAWAHDHFLDAVKPVLTPIGLDPAHPFPMVHNKGLCFLVEVEGQDAFDRGSRFAVVQVPRSLPRVIQVPAKAARKAHRDFVLLSSLVHAHLDLLFPGMDVLGGYAFRITRNSDLWVDEEEVENLKIALQGELTRRSFGEAVRLEVAADMTAEGCALLLEKEDLGEEDLYRVDGPVNLHRLAALVDLVDRRDLKYPAFVPGNARRVRESDNLFATIAQRDLLLHHPYQGFAPIVELVRQAARDPQVLAIKQTLYRTDPDSPIVRALVDAALAGKDVTALVELRARFDEAANISMAQRLEEVGANVVYGIVGYKAHAKLLLIVRREGKKLRRFVHLGTGNYHTGTAKAYTDFGLLTASKRFGEDVQAVFDELTGLGQKPRLTRLVQSPFTLYESVIEGIQAEARAARAGRKARIVARMNSLSEANVIRALYDASQAGVDIDLLVRGICCLRPGVPGLSETIRVRSIVGRFLEHARAWWFHAGGRDLTWLSSADWMSRNLHRRVETAFPIRAKRLKGRLHKEAFELLLEDNCQAWLLQPDGTYVQARPAAGEPRRSAQEALLARWADHVA